MTEGTHPRQTEIMPTPRDEYLAEMFRAIRLGASGRIPMTKVAMLTSVVEEERHRGAPLPACTAELHRGTEELLARYPPADGTAADASPPEQPGQEAVAI